MTTPEYTLDYRQARIALMTEPEGTIIEASSGYQVKIEDAKIQTKYRQQSRWEYGCCIPYSCPRYRIIPLPTPEPTPHVNPTLEECFAATKLTGASRVSGKGVRLDKTEKIQQALALALETLSEQTAPEHPVWAEIERLLGGKIDE